MFDIDERVFGPKGNWDKMIPIRLINDVFFISGKSPQNPTMAVILVPRL